MPLSPVVSKARQQMPNPRDSVIFACAIMLVRIHPYYMNLNAKGAVLSTSDIFAWLNNLPHGHNPVFHVPLELLNEVIADTRIRNFLIKKKFFRFDEPVQQFINGKHTRVRNFRFPESEAFINADSLAPFHFMTPSYVPNLISSIKTEADIISSHLQSYCSEHTDIYAAIAAEATAVDCSDDLMIANANAITVTAHNQG